MKAKILHHLLEQSGSIVPIVDGKRSILGWNKYSNNPPTVDELNNWISSQEYEGYGLFMGYGGYQVLDIDQKNVPSDFTGSVFQEIWKEVPRNLRKKLVVQRTMSGGEHILYRCPVKAKKQVLAKSPEKGRPVIETIGDRNYIRIYDDVASGSLDKVQAITEKEHKLLLQKSGEVGDRLFGTQSTSIKVNETPKFTAPNKKYSTDDNFYFISASAAEIERSGVDITENYEDWIKVGYAIANETGETGRDYFHKISSNNIGYDPAEIDVVFTSMLKGREKNGKATGASLRHLLKEHGITAPKKESKVAIKIKTAIEHIRAKGLRKNKFTNKVEIPNGELITDSDVNDIYLELRQSGVSISKADVASIINSSNIRIVNPLREWIKNSEQFANGHVIDDLLDCLILKDNDPETKKFIRAMVVKWLLQIPAMILEDVPPRLVLVAIGETYIGKSELFRRLLPEKFGKYYAESGLDREKDSEILMSEHLLVNVDELAGIMRSSKQVERFKSLSSSKYFTLRTPYGKISERFQRKAILCGTSNKLDVIVDHDTGNTRIIPMELVDIDKEKCNAINRNALFGSLTKLYRDVGAGHLYLTPDERTMLQQISDDHTVVNPEQEIILKYLKPCDAIDTQFQTVSDISNYLIKHTSLQLDPRKVSRELSKLGFIKTRKRVDGSTSALNGFYIEQIYRDSDQIKMMIMDNS